MKLLQWVWNVVSLFRKEQKTLAEASEPVSIAESSALCGGLSSMFRRRINLGELLTERLAGLTMSLGGGTLSFPSTMLISGDSKTRTIHFTPSATANVGGLVGKANVSGVRFNQSFTEMTPLIDGLPDLITVEVVW